MSNEHVTEKPDVAKWIILGMLGGIIMSVLALQYYGFLVMPKKEDSAIIDEFRLLNISTDADLKVSPKVSGKMAFCVDGYLLLRPVNGNEVAGILVDSKNRPTQCQIEINRPSL